MTAASTESTSDSRCFKRSTAMSCDVAGGGWMEGQALPMTLKWVAVESRMTRAG